MTSLVSGSSSVTVERTGNGSGSGAGSGVGGAQGSGVAAPIAPVVEPPASFGIVAPGIHRCSASSLTQGLPNAPRNHSKAAKPAAGSSSSSASGSANGSQANLATPSNPATPTESFLSSLQLKTIVLLAPEKKPAPLATWCSINHVQLIHLGLGALADKDEKSIDNSEINTSIDRLHPSLSLEKSLESYGGLPDSGILSLERIVKDSLEILLYRSRLPCLVCDTSGVNETGVVVGCLRRMQRRSFASIRYEYRAFAGNRSRSSHERFIEMFDPDLISLPSSDKLPMWFVQQQMDDEAEEKILIDRR